MIKQLALFVLVAASSLAFAHAKTGGEDAIKARVAEFNMAWDKGDAKTIASFWTEDGTIINPVGMEAHNRGEVQKIIEMDMGTILKGAHANLTIDHVHMINATTAWCEGTHAFTNLKTPDGKPAPDMNAHVVTLAVKKGGTWMWQDARPYFFMPKDHGAKMAAK
jgi:uncharacterized protein (TIGR02246 family)